MDATRELQWQELLEENDGRLGLDRFQEFISVHNFSREDWNWLLAQNKEWIFRQLWSHFSTFSSKQDQIQAARLLNMIYSITDRIVPSTGHSALTIVSLTYEFLTDPETKVEILLTFLTFFSNVFDSTMDNMDLGTLRNSNVFHKCISKLLELQQDRNDALREISTCVLAALNLHLRQFESNLLLQMIRESDAIGENILRLINTFGYPNTQVKRLQHVLLFVQDLLDCETTCHFLYLNDFKIMIEVLLRECVDLPVEEPSREWYLIILRRLILSSDYIETNKHRRREIVQMLETLLETSHLESQSHRACQLLLLDCISILD